MNYFVATLYTAVALTFFVLAITGEAFTPWVSWLSGAIWLVGAGFWVWAGTVQ